MPKIKLFGTAGTGKTHHLLENIQELNKTIEYKDMIVCTFRRSAANDVIQKINVDTNEDRRYMSTLHGVCYRLLDYPVLISPSELNTFCQRSGLSSTNNHHMNYQDREDLTPSRQETSFFNFYGWVQNTMTSDLEYSLYPHQIKKSTSNLKYLINEYEEYKQEIGKLDYADLLSEVVEQGLTPAGAKAMIVDEFQDFTPAQYEVFEMWDDTVGTTIIAGDPNQTIYPFWGGTSRYFDEYDAELNILPTSYRVPSQIWDIAKKTLTQNSISVPEIDTVKNNGNVKIVNYRQAESILPEYSTKTYHLVRANYQGVPISYQLAEAGIVYTGNINAWSDSEITLLNAIIKIRNNNVITQKELIQLVIDIPKEFFKYTSSKNEYIEYIKEQKRVLYHPQDIIEITQSHRTFGGAAFYDVILSDDPTVYMTNIGKLKKLKISNAIKKYSKPVIIDPDAVRIHTIHGAKGLEADTIFLHTAITPNIKKSMRTADGKKDESRVWFVGLTRAAQSLFIVKDKGNNNYPIPGGAS